MKYPLVSKDFKWDSFCNFVICGLIAMIIAMIGFVVMVAKARAEENINELFSTYLKAQIAATNKSTKEVENVISNVQEGCAFLKVSDEDTRLLQAIILAHLATNTMPLFAQDDIGFASWIKMMRYLHDEKKDIRPLLDFCFDWCEERWANYAMRWKDKVKIFLEENENLQRVP